MAEAPAGWYPQEDGRQRYWDGGGWTDHFAAGAAHGGVTGAPAVGAGLPVSGPAGSPARPWFKKKRYVIPAGLAGVIIIGSALGAGGSEQPDKPAALTDVATSVTPSAADVAATTSATPSPTPSKTPTPSPTRSATPKPAAPKPAPPKPAAPKLTVAQENAKGAAEDYLDYAGFSKKGLIKQLEFEGYKLKDITAALATMKVNWNDEAAEAAHDYVDFTHFSRSGLINQLEFDGFTSKQAAYGAKSVGL